VFSKIGNGFVFDSRLFSTVESFFCKLYGLKCKNTDEGRYLKLVATKNTPDPQRLPPARDALLCHCKRVCFVTAIVKRALQATVSPPAIGQHHVWVIENGELKVQWMICKPDVLQLISCNCQKSGCLARSCLCFAHGLKCTDLCKCCEICENCGKKTTKRMATMMTKTMMMTTMMKQPMTTKIKLHNLLHN